MSVEYVMDFGLERAEDLTESEHLEFLDDFIALVEKYEFSAGGGLRLRKAPHCRICGGDEIEERCVGCGSDEVVY